MIENLEVKKSNIGQFKCGFGLFAKKNFKKGEIVKKYNLRELSKQEFKDLPKEEKEFTHKRNGKILLYPVPERYVNHSNDPNTIQDFEIGADIAVRNIKKGEEITTDSTKEDF